MPDEPTRVLPVFPLGSVLLPGMPLPLRVFEPRYVALLSDVLGADEREFGVVLIERGSEVGGGDVRFGTGTVARIVQVEVGEGLVVLVARGTERFEVVRWLDDDPYPRAEVRMLPALVPEDPAALAEAERVVRETLVRAAEFVELPWPADVALADDPAARMWQLAGIAPLGALDTLALLRSTTAAALLARLVEETRAVLPTLEAGWLDDGEGDEDDPR
ncbi:LON peptidase substrate-binding domain-containing protein [Cellulomonas marina]|uniref:Lon N-terminal domain-containing protein n=1 Tax=Cellulomonas marina TaxID=988821 RepID=A0A1I0W5E9_9CELL|nr:LON peptidase substrate-binding domain-containing protein [Cellulomonas marina]GIG30532.1 hypothetical protein Cma02nite_31320 [Cellulomonas marina]SFA83771.1 hypothetical protein SAMN05421867_102189 [Cellulomonas marina]